MQILIGTKVYSPSIGGVEAIASILKSELSKLGHKVVLATETRSSNGAINPTILRNPSRWELFRQYVAADAVILMGATIRLGWPLLLLKRPILISHQGYKRQSRGILDFRFLLRSRLMARAINVACSQSVAESYGKSCRWTGNPYDTRAFFQRRGVKRNKDVVFVGRLVPEKGPDILLRAVSILKEKQVHLKCSIVGDGPLSDSLRRIIIEENLEESVKLIGSLQDAQLGEFLNEHRVMVVPSVWEEPFGIVALEGAASGCLVIGSDRGGLPNALGIAGITFTSGNPDDLANKILQALKSESMKKCKAEVESHLARHSPSVFTKRLVGFLDGALNQ